ncbi:hypothetical protein RFI_13140 [Reticulomyxa filosa]|uniref:Uncharacterized protein n=1 Tax=Reticulomyxa filosa TaxID=46433 RepID=X6NDF4_RETFI|nr:hypothetical protein RFI_13140 [Reticulomyxa filosa]|eukprot:ETO24021.1 hypothetical protein RFI_13140 [Reticulomyxa filosa]
MKLDNKQKGNTEKVYACLLVYDITNAQSFKQIETWKKNFLEQAYIEDTEKFPFVLCGNKSDLEQSRAVSTQDGERLANQHKMLFYETSALSGKNINEVIQKIATIGGDSETVPSIQANIANKALKLDLETQETKTPPTSNSCAC